MNETGLPIIESHLTKTFSFEKKNHVIKNEFRVGGIYPALKEPSVTGNITKTWVMAADH